jgi:hypothetical protein
VLTATLASSSSDSVHAADGGTVPSTTIGCSVWHRSLATTKVSECAPRSTSSPFRSSQWVARGGLLRSPRRGQACTSDRYIAARRPPAITRESFEMNKPTERREATRAIHGGQFNSDPFSQRLRRSGRLNDELRGLREAHSLLMERASALRRNNNLAHRHNLDPSSIRQISAGAVWNVGGPSAVSDTVVAVSTGRGGMLGTGTNAPLYISNFLNRADPEAELEAYERRLALALDVDQIDRVLQHSSTPPTISKANHHDLEVLTRHTWRDSAWIKDGITSRLSITTKSTLIPLADFSSKHFGRHGKR